MNVPLFWGETAQKGGEPTTHPNPRNVFRFDEMYTLSRLTIYTVDVVLFSKKVEKCFSRALVKKNSCLQNSDWDNLQRNNDVPVHVV